MRIRKSDMRVESSSLLEEQTDARCAELLQKCTARKNRRPMRGMRINISDLPPKAQAQVAQKLLRQEQEKQRKYHNEPCKVDGIKFDSQKEARRYRELMVRFRAGRIQDLKLQPQFTLQESYKTPEGKRVQAIRYVADFSYFDCDLDKDVVEDVKSKATKTRVYEMKKKMLLDRYGIEIREV